MVRFKVINQGQPVVNDAPPAIVAQADNIVAFEIDMRSKWCVVDATTTGSDNRLAIHIGTTERSCHLDESKELPWTEVEFPDFPSNEWDIFAAECNRYTLRMVLTKRQ